MDLSVIIPCYNGAQTIGVQLGALAAQRWEGSWEVIVVDNGSTDATLTVVQEYFGRLPYLRIVPARARRGAAHARNVGVAAARGTNVVFLDADDAAQAGWLAAIGAALQHHPFVASRFEFQSLNRASAVLAPIAPQEHGLQRYSNPKFLSHAGTCGLGVRRILHEGVGGFDESMDMLEDTDYCWRLQLSGVPLHFIPEAVVAVRYRDSLRRMCYQARSWGAHTVKLNYRYRVLGMPPWSLRRDMRQCAKLVRRARQLAHVSTRTQWLWHWNWYAGRMIGWLRYGGRAHKAGSPQLLARPMAVLPHKPRPSGVAQDVRPSAGSLKNLVVNGRQK